MAWHLGHARALVARIAHLVGAPPLFVHRRLTLIRSRRAHPQGVRFARGTIVAVWWRTHDAGWRSLIQAAATSPKRGGGEPCARQGSLRQGRGSSEAREESYGEKWTQRWHLVGEAPSASVDCASDGMSAGRRSDRGHRTGPPTCGGRRGGGGTGRPNARARAPGASSDPEASRAEERMHRRRHRGRATAFAVDCVAAPEGAQRGGIDSGKRRWPTSLLLHRATCPPPSEGARRGSVGDSVAVGYFERSSPTKDFNFVIASKAASIELWPRRHATIRSRTSAFSRSTRSLQLWR